MPLLFFFACFPNPFHQLSAERPLSSVCGEELKRHYNDFPAGKRGPRLCGNLHKKMSSSEQIICGTSPFKKQFRIQLLQKVIKPMPITLGQRLVSTNLKSPRTMCQRKAFLTQLYLERTKQPLLESPCRPVSLATQCLH